MAVEAAAPIAGCVTGPGCRTQREERILAWLLQDSRACRDDIPPLEEHTFSTHTRAEIFLAWRQAAESRTALSAAEVRHALARRLLRAPAWAATSVGWPFGQLALTYLDRLAATPVTRLQADTAARELFREDTAATERARGASAVVARTATGMPRGPAAQASNPRPEPWPPDDPSPGTAPRV